jgi:putative transposase
LQPLTDIAILDLMSGRRNLVFANNEYYHVLNRSIAKEEILSGKREVSRFLALIDYYRYLQKLSFSKYKKLPRELRNLYYNNYKDEKPLVELYAFSLMPDHFHILIKQLKDNGLQTYMANIQNAFAKYFNTKEKRDGGLFKRPFRVRRIENDEDFLHLSRYIHLNHVTSFLVNVESLEKLVNTSYYLYFNSIDNDIINTEFLLKLAGTKENYKKFVEDRADFQRKLARIKRLLLE